jgi:hypothetical protein
MCFPFLGCFPDVGPTRHSLPLFTLHTGPSHPFLSPPHPATSLLLPASGPRSTPHPHISSAGWSSGLVSMDVWVQVGGESPLPTGGRSMSTWVWVELPCLMGDQGRGRSGALAQWGILGRGISGLGPSPPVSPPASSSEQRWLLWLCAHPV